MFQLNQIVRAGQYGTECKIIGLTRGNLAFVDMAGERFWVRFADLRSFDPDEPIEADAEEFVAAA